MSVIEISRSHALGVDEAKKTADRLAVGLSERFDINYQWRGNLLKFHRPGLKGMLEVSDLNIHIKLTLGLMFTPFKAKLEKEIHSRLDDMEGID